MLEKAPKSQVFPNFSEDQEGIKEIITKLQFDVISGDWLYCRLYCINVIFVHMRKIEIIILETFCNL